MCFQPVLVWSLLMRSDIFTISSGSGKALLFYKHRFSIRLGLSPSRWICPDPSVKVITPPSLPVPLTRCICFPTVLATLKLTIYLLSFLSSSYISAVRTTTSVSYSLNIPDAGNSLAHGSCSINICLLNRWEPIPNSNQGIAVFWLFWGTRIRLISECEMKRGKVFGSVLIFKLPGSLTFS